MTRFLICISALFALAGYTKLVWQSGFDDGADVAICVKASFTKELRYSVVTVAKDPACARAHAYERNPLWAFRRRGG